MVLDDPASAQRAAAAGQSVVLIVDVDDPSFSLPPSVAGRVAVFVGPGDQPATWAAAEEMAAELFFA